MVKILPLLEAETRFALKGGTAINLFIRDFPRYSVDIDLTYLPLEDRDTSLAGISEALSVLAKNVVRLVPGTEVKKKITGRDQRISKLFIQRKSELVKIEPNEILRGCVYPPQRQPICPEVAQLFSTQFSVLLANPADIYRGKICAALDRQHPRDLFDIKLLLEEEGITEEIKKAFVVYLACHSRPMDELLNPNFVDVETTFKSQFEGMSRTAITCEELTLAREQLVSLLRQRLADNEKGFILSLAEGAPHWELLGFEHIKNLPALKWKLQNIKKMSKKKHLESVKRLEVVLKGGK